MITHIIIDTRWKTDGLHVTIIEAGQDPLRVSFSWPDAWSHVFYILTTAADAINHVVVKVR